MSSFLLQVLTGLSLQVAGGVPDDLRAVLREVRHAVEVDSTAAVEARWSSRRQDGLDRTALLALGSLARLTYQYHVADTLLTRVVATGDADDVADYARIERARGLMAQGRLTESDVDFSRAASGAEARSDTLAWATALLGLALIRSRSATDADAVGLLDRAEGLVGGDRALQANVLCQRAAALARGGRAGAVELAETGAGMARDAGDLRQEGVCLQAAAQAAASIGDIDGAFRALAQAAPVMERARDRGALAAILQWRGYLYVTLGRYGEARADLTAATREGERAGAMSPVGWALINLGMISLGLGDRVTATAQLERAWGLLSAQGDAWGAATARSMLGGVARARSDIPAARRAYEEVLGWAEGAGNIQTQFNMHEALGSLAEMTGDWAVAEEEYRLCEALARTHGMSGFLAGLAYNRGRLALRRGDLDAAEAALSTYLAGQDERQHSARYATRAQLAEVYARQGFIARSEAELTAASEELDRWRTSLPEHDLRVRAAEFDRAIDPDLGVAWVISALAQAGRVDAAFDLVERGRARELSDGIYRARAARLDTDRPGSPVLAGLAGGAEGARALTDPTTAFLEYVTGRGGEPTTLFVVRPGGIVSFDLAPVDSLEGDVRRFLALVEAGGELGPLGRKLGEALLSPAVQVLDDRVQRLVIVPDDVLGRLPFDALVLPDGRYALERFAISFVPAVSTLRAIRDRPTNGSPLRLLAFGDPRFGTSTPASEADERGDPVTAIYAAAFEAAGGLPRLRGSGREARDVARYAPAAEVRLDLGASESYLRAAPLDSFRVVHFATHAIVDDDATTRTVLALAPGGGQDGFLGAVDLASLPLDADLVVLSACQTAGGVVLRGEGIQGMTAPLLQAGARAVVATNWRIADEGSGRVMTAMYAGLAHGQTVGDALHHAKLASLRGGAPAGEWAAFVAVGDPATRVPLVTPSSRAGWTLLVGAAILLGLGSLYRGVTRKRVARPRA
jgi:CHAT domain-containing protein/tetratricopeptide (TPR) repeat protein